MRVTSPARSKLPLTRTGKSSSSEQSNMYLADCVFRSTIFLSSNEAQDGEQLSMLPVS
jgi:hypothetical protein